MFVAKLNVAERITYRCLGGGDILEALLILARTITKIVGMQKTLTDND
jgi:hypothetical protein